MTVNQLGPNYFVEEIDAVDEESFRLALLVLEHVWWRSLYSHLTLDNNIEKLADVAIVEDVLILLDHDKF